MMDCMREGLLKAGQTLVCIGDSITYAPEGYVTTVREVLALRFPDSPPQVINAGIGGDTVKQMLARFDNDVLAHNPDWVSIMAGVADTVYQLLGRPDATVPEELGSTPQEFGQAVNAMVASAQEAGAKVALCTPNHFEDHWESGDAGLANDNIVDKTACLYQAAEQGDVLLVPTAEVLLRAAQEACRQGQQLLFTPDGFHPDEMGHAMMALTFLASFGYELDLPQVQ